MRETVKNIVTIKWGDAFSAEDVNILKRAVVNNCTGRVNFICLTDNGIGLDEDIFVVDIPTAGLASFPRAKGVWGKICLFHRTINGLFDHGLFLDIDTVVVGNLDDFFIDPGPRLRMLSAGRRWRAKDEKIAPRPATGVFYYAPSLHNHIFDNFSNNPEMAYSQFNLEQDFVGANSSEIEYFPVSWIDSFKYHLRRSPLLDQFFEPKSPNKDAKLVAFHGFPRPSMVAVSGNIWTKFPRTGRNRPKWLADYWNKYRG